MSQSPRRSLTEGSPVRDRSRDRDSVSRSRSRSGDRHSRRSESPRHRRDDRYKEERDDRYKEDDRYREDRSSRRRYSRSPSPRDRRSRYDERRSRSRSRSRSPIGGRRRHHDNRENPQPNKCLGIFGLSTYTTERQLRHLFSKYGPLDKVQVVLDANTGRSRGFAFIYYEHTEDATEAKEQCTGMDIDGRQIRVDYSVTKRAHTPTPGIYMGRPTYSGYGGGGSSRYGGGGRSYGGGGYSGGRRGRSPSPHYRSDRDPPPRRSYRSRSRSYSPRR